MQKSVRLGGLVVASALIFMVRPAGAVVLTEGGSSETLDSISALPVGDSLVATSPPANFNIADIQIGTITSQVYSHTGGTYDFVYQLNMSPSAVNALTGYFAIYNYDTYTVDASYLAGTGATFTTGQFESNGYMTAATVVLVGQSTDPLVIQTNARNYALDGATPGYTGIDTVYTPAAVPEPATAGLIASAVGILAVRRARVVSRNI